MFRDYGYYMIGMHAVWWIFWLIALVVVGYAFWGRWGGGGDASSESARQLLRRRLASGEIAPDEYEQRVALLNRDQ